MVTAEYKKKRIKNMIKRRKYLNSNYTKKDMVYLANKNRLVLRISDSKHRLVDLILMNEFGSYRMGNNKLNPKKVF